MSKPTLRHDPESSIYYRALKGGFWNTEAVKTQRCVSETPGTDPGRSTSMASWWTDSICFRKSSRQQTPRWNCGRPVLLGWRKRTSFWSGSMTRSTLPVLFIKYGPKPLESRPLFGLFVCFLTKPWAVATIPYTPPILCPQNPDVRHLISLKRSVLWCHFTLSLQKLH